MSIRIRKECICLQSRQKDAFGGTSKLPIEFQGKELLENVLSMCSNWEFSSSMLDVLFFILASEKWNASIILTITLLVQQMAASRQNVCIIEYAWRWHYRYTSPKFLILLPNFTISAKFCFHLLPLASSYIQVVLFSPFLVVFVTVLKGADYSVRIIFNFSICKSSSLCTHGRHSNPWTNPNTGWKWVHSFTQHSSLYLFICWRLG